MQYAEGSQDIEFRQRARAWLEENVPGEPRPSGSGAEARAFDQAWQRRQCEGGWAGLAWPSAYGGLGLPAHLQVIWYEEYARAGAPEPRGSFVGLNHAGPTLIARGTEAQKQEHLPQILRGEALWCQGFSEPDAGSDLASLRTKGVVDGDHLIVSGQKIWTSYADIADFQELLVRTDAAAPKHRGITWVIADMSSSGIEVRPIETIAGGGHFSEVFYDEVAIPLSNVVGELNDGWSVTLTTLSFERGTAFIAEQMRLAIVVRDLVELAAVLPSPAGSGTALEDGHVRQQLGWMLASVEALRAMTYQLVSRSERASGPIPDGSVTRAWFSTLAQDVAHLAFDLRSWASVHAIAQAPDRRNWNHEYFWSFQETIGGGTLEVQKNIIGERLLGLPKE
jgi:alkylation response protein AidB-like acyl-CoA dehydrogenase